MAADTATRNSGLRPDGFRRLDHLEAGVCVYPKRSPGSHRVRMHVPSSPVRSTYDIVRAWTVIVTTSGAGGALLAILSSRGHW